MKKEEVIKSRVSAIKKVLTALAVAIPEIAPTQDPIDIENLFLIIRKDHKYQI